MTLRSLRLGFVAFSAAFVVALTLYPFRFRVPTGLGSAWVTLFHGTEGPWQIAENVVFFMPFGLALSLCFRARTWRPLPILLAVLALSFALSYTVEFIQHFVPGRSSSRLDLLANSLGGLLAAIVHLLWQRKQFLLLAGYGLFLLVGSCQLQGLTSLKTWNVNYPLVLANEHNGQRPWNGVLSEVVFLDRALSQQQLSTERPKGNGFVDGGHPDFIGAYRRVEIVEPWNPLPGPNPMRLQAVGDTPALIPQSRGSERWEVTTQPPRELIERLKDSNRFTVLLALQPADLTQDGPARIVTISPSIKHRNFMIGQQGRDLVVRIRTPLTGLNGFGPQLLVPEVFTDLEMRRLAVTYDGATLQVYNNEEVLEPSLALGPPLLVQRWGAERNSPSLARCKLLYYGALFLPLGLLASLHAGRRGWPLLVFGLIAFALSLEVFLTFAGRRALQLDAILYAAGFALLGLALAAVAIRSTRRWRPPARKT